MEALLLREEKCEACGGFVCIYLWCRGLSGVVVKSRCSAYSGSDQSQPGTFDLLFELINCHDCSSSNPSNL